MRSARSWLLFVAHLNHSPVVRLIGLHVCLHLRGSADAGGSGMGAHLGLSRDRDWAGVTGFTVFAGNPSVAAWASDAPPLLLFAVCVGSHGTARGRNVKLSALMMLERGHLHCADPVCCA